MPINPQYGVHRDRDNSRVALNYAGTRRLSVNSTGASVNGTLAVSGAQTASGDVTVIDDGLLAVGTGSTARVSWDTTDANANELLIQLPAGGSVDVPVIAIGQSIESVDLGLYNGVVDPKIAMFGVGAVATGPTFEFRKARGTIAAPTVVTTGDDLGQIRAYGAVAAGEYVQAASIEFDMAGTIATTRGPGTITFKTATDAAPSVLTTAMTISAAQVVTMAAAVTTGDHKFSSTITAGADGVGADGEQLTSGGAGAECDWSAAGSMREFKKILRIRSDEDKALEQIVSTPVYDFKYKSRDEYDGGLDHPITTGDLKTEYTGLMADEAPWAMHHSGRILNPINSLGYTILGFKALLKRVEALEGAMA